MHPSVSVDLRAGGEIDEAADGRDRTCRCRACRSPGGTGLRAQEPAGLPISAQLYTVRSVGTLDEQLATIARAGIKYVEPFRFNGMKEVPAEELKALLDKHGLKVSGMHINIGALIEDTDRTVEYNKAIGNTRLIVPALPASITPKDKAGWQAMGRLFATLAATLKPKGMQVGFHNHTVEMEVFDGQHRLRVVRRERPAPTSSSRSTSPGPHAAGRIRRRCLAGSRDTSGTSTSKDNAPEGTAADERGFAIAGKGTVDWDRVLPAAQGRRRPLFHARARHAEGRRAGAEGRQRVPHREAREAAEPVVTRLGCHYFPVQVVTLVREPVVRRQLHVARLADAGRSERQRSRADPDGSASIVPARRRPVPGSSTVGLQHVPRLALVDDDLIAWGEAFAAPAGRRARSGRRRKRRRRARRAAARRAASSAAAPRRRSPSRHSRVDRRRSRPATAASRASGGRSRVRSFRRTTPGGAREASRVPAVPRRYRQPCVTAVSGKRRASACSVSPIAFHVTDRRDEEVDVTSASRAVEVDRVAVLRVVLHSRARAAPERLARACDRASRIPGASPGSRSSSRSPDPATPGCRCRARARSSRRRRRTGRREQHRVSRSMLCVQHVSIVFAEPRCFANSATREEVLVVAVAAGDERAVARRPCCQKKRAAAPYRCVAGQLVQPLEADDFRDLRVGSAARRADRVPRRAARAAPRWLKRRASVEVLRLAGQRRDVREHLVHAAVLGVEHALRSARRSWRASRAHVHVGEPRRAPSSAPAARRRTRARRAGRRRSCASCTTARRRTAGPRRHCRAASRRRGTRTRARSPRAV